MRVYGKGTEKFSWYQAAQIWEEGVFVNTYEENFEKGWGLSD